LYLGKSKLGCLEFFGFVFGPNRNPKSKKASA